MKCPHCGMEVVRGTLFCPECLTEIPWVPEYNTVETLMTREQTKKEENGQKERRRIEKKRKKQRIFAGAAVLAFVLLLGLGGKLLLDYRNDNSYTYQYKKAESAYSKQKYDRAEGYIVRALELEEESLSGNLLYARILQEQGEEDLAEKLLKSLLKKHPEETQIYKALIRLYRAVEQPEKIHTLLSECDDEKIREHFSNYVVIDPSASAETGVYDSEIEVSLSAGDSTVYYTLDGTVPTEKSMRYREPIPMREGVNELCAFSVNARGIASDSIRWKYTVVLKSPDAPVITPAAGVYREPVTITMEVPEGCKGYYVFDGQVSTASQEYKKPVEMPEGTHIFRAVLVAANGKESETVEVEYTFDASAGKEP